MWKGFTYRHGLELDALAIHTLWIRSMLDDKASFEAIRESFGFKETI